MSSDQEDEDLPDTVQIGNVEVRISTLIIYLVAAAIRIGIFLAFPNVVTVLSDSVEISTPISSYKRLQEGLFLYERGVSPYDGGVFHQAPLMLVIFQVLPPIAVFTCLDLLNAHNLTSVAKSLRLPSLRFRALNETQIAAIYLFNPFTIVSSLGCSTTLVTNAAILQAVASAASGHAFGAMFALASATYLSLYPGLLLPPVMLYLLKTRSTNVSSRIILPLVAMYGLIAAILFGGSVLLIGGNVMDFLASCYGAQISVTDLTPNIGLWWYFFIEIFDAFRSFFVGVFWIHLIGYVGALTVRLPEQPLFVIIALFGLIAIFKPYPSTSDVSLYLGMLPLYQHIMPRKLPYLSQAIPF